MAAFAKQLTAALAEEAANLTASEIDEHFTTALSQTKEAAEDFDSVLALGYISKLREFSYNTTVDNLLTVIANALESFNCESALEAIKELERALL
jgi:16S rRNA A1518/A1519 N6-dimethyltransferase RsmA/KsgA/DIM1 with predicted DNA glycosylase/AP lyase activity